MSPAAAAPGAFPWDPRGGNTGLIQQITGILGGAWKGMWPNFAPYVPDADGAAVTRISDPIAGNDATPVGTGPTYNQSLFNGRGGVTYIANRRMATGNIDMTAYDKLVMITTFVDTITSLAGVGEHASSGVNGRCLVTVNATGAGRVNCFGQSGGNAGQADSANTFPMTSVGTVTGICQALATNATFIRVNGVDVTSARPLNPSFAAYTGANRPTTIGGLSGGGNDLAGSIFFIGLLGYTSSESIPLDLLSLVEQMLTAAASS